MAILGPIIYCYCIIAFITTIIYGMNSRSTDGWEIVATGVFWPIHFIIGLSKGLYRSLKG